MRPQVLIVQHNLMKNAFAFFLATVSLFASSCHRPVGYFQRTPHAAARISPEPAKRVSTEPKKPRTDSVLQDDQGYEPMPFRPELKPEAVVSIQAQPGSPTTGVRLGQRMRRVESMLVTSAKTVDKQPRPKPKPKNQLRLGNRIRQELGLPLREELNWWQRISWKLKASVIVILVAVLFAILHITILAIIFGIVGAFLLITGLKRSFKVRRPWF